MTWALLIAGSICVALALHPFTTYPLSLALLRRLLGRTSPPLVGAPAVGRFALCLCVYNEENVIADKIANLLALRDREPELEILIYVDAASDRTAQLLAPYAAQFNLHVSATRHGKTHGMNLLVARTDADFIIFTDANVMLESDIVARLRAHFADPGIGCVCGNLRYVNGNDTVTAATGSRYWRLEQTIKRLEQVRGSVMGADGSLFAIRRSLHHPAPDHIIDDMYVSFRILCAGYRVVQADDVYAYEQSVSVAGEEYRRKIRIACQAFNVHRLLRPHLRRLDGFSRYKYVSHKLLRWWCIYFLIGGGLLIEAALLLWPAPLPALGLPVLLLGSLWLGLRWRLPPFIQIVDVLQSLLGAGVGVWRSLRGERYQTWQPAQSIRRQS